MEERCLDRPGTHHARPFPVVQSSPLLDVSHASVIRGATLALCDITFSLTTGEHTVILGPNGAGKSSLIRLLTLVDRPVTGRTPAPSVRWFGREHWVVADLHRRLGIVSGELDAGFALWSRRGRVTGLEAVTAGLLVSHAIFDHHAVSEAMWDAGRAALARVDAASLGETLLGEMSAGQRRRVLIARALVTRPDALLLDEPTTGLDLASRHHFMETVRGLARSGTTIVLVTHHVEEIFPEVRRVLLLSGGRLQADGPPAETLTGPQLAALFGVPLTVVEQGGYRSVLVHPPERDRR